MPSDSGSRADIEAEIVFWEQLGPVTSLQLGIRLNVKVEHSTRQFD